MLKFSVLLSIYYKENPSFLHSCLESLFLNKKFIPDEILIIKDGPLNSALESTLDLWLNKYPNVIKTLSLEINQGLGFALNYGISFCRNNWVFRMDTDDLCSPDRFEKQIQYIEDNPTVSLFGSNIAEFDITMKYPQGIRTVPTTYNQITQQVKKRNPFNHMTVAFRKDIIESVGGYQHHLYMEDYNLWIRVIAAGHQVGNIDEVLVNVRGGDSMIKRRKGLIYIKSELQLAKLKIEKKIDSPFNAYINFIIRSIPRLLPTYMLSKVYKKLRK
ncbi:glycosyltransferase [Providencia stuartii]|nr:glycosyltransferase [Providencia stuartii]